MEGRKPIVIVGEARGEAEDKLNSCFVGPSGAALIQMLGESEIITLTSFDRDYLHGWYRTQESSNLEAIWGLHPEVYRTNVFQIHPPGNDLEFFCGGKAEGIAGYPMLLKSKYVRTEFEPELDRLCREILERDPNLIICLGNTALWALAGRQGITKLRGTTLLSTHTVSGFKLLPTFHPAAILRQWENRPTAIADLMKAKRESLFPEIRRPYREIWIEPSLDDIRRFISDHVTDCDLLSVDIETAGQRITCIGFAPDARTAIVIPFDDERRKDGSYWPSREAEVECWKLVRSVLVDPGIRKLFQNGVYDIAFLYRSMKIKVLGAAEDTMLLQHAIQPEALKGLGYLGSIYSDEGSWKHMRKKHETIKRDD
jgi:uracil-DNA glycosylase